MAVFRRAIRFLLGVLAVVMGGVVGAAVALSRRMTRPERQALWASPDDVGLAFEEVTFPARGDAVRLEGWFMPARGETNGRVVVLAHGWGWNRLGDAREGVAARLARATSIDLLRLAHGLHHEGYHVLMYDGRNHGESAAKGAVTFGYAEANDLLGARDFLETRSEVDASRMGVMGFGMGANAVLYALAREGEFATAVLVQPTTPAVLMAGMGRDLYGPLGKMVVGLADYLARRRSALPLNALTPAFAAATAVAVPTLILQAKNEPWGSTADVERIAAKLAIPPQLVWVDGSHRYDGYGYPIEHTEVVFPFLAEHLQG